MLEKQNTAGSQMGFQSFLNADLTNVKQKIKQEIKKGVVDWDDKKCDDVESLYKHWMVCAEKYRNEATFIPNKDIDIFWHFHILHTKQYMNDCQKYFGRYIHHNPHLVETEEMRVNRKRSKEIFLKEMGIGNEQGLEWASCFWEPDEDEKNECSKCD